MVRSAGAVAGPSGRMRYNGPSGTEDVAAMAAPTKAAFAELEAVQGDEEDAE